MKTKLFKNIAVLGLLIGVIVPVITIAKNTRIDVDGTPLPPGLSYREFVHYPRVPNGGKPPRVRPSCTVTESNPSTYWLAGWHLAGARVYRINDATIPSTLNLADVYQATNDAWVEWNGADSAITVTQGVPTSASRAKYDGTNLIAFGRVSNGAIAVTYTWYNTGTGEQVESDTVFN